MLANIISKIPDWLEVLIVLLLAFGMSIASSIYAFTSGTAFESLEFSSLHLVEVIVSEFLFGAICLAFLYLRGYNVLKEVRFDISIKGVAIAIGLFFATYFAYAIVWIIASVVVGPIPVAEIKISASVFLILAVAVINPLFEEFFLLTYLGGKLAAYGPVLFIFLSTVIRISYHLYQGWVGIISILPIGVIFAVVYWKTKNLMPFYLSHALMDLTGLLSQQ